MIVSYVIGGVVLERVQVMRYFGVFLDQGLTFGEHVERTLRKANRALGLLVQTYATGESGRPFGMSYHRAIMSTYSAHVRPILAWCGVQRRRRI